MSLDTGVYFLVLLQVGMTEYLSFLGVPRAQHAAPPKLHFSCVAPYSRMYSRLSLSKATALTRHYGPARASTATVATPLLLITIGLQYMTAMNDALGITDIFPLVDRSTTTAQHT